MAAGFQGRNIIFPAFGGEEDIHFWLVIADDSVELTLLKQVPTVSACHA